MQFRHFLTLIVIALVLVPGTDGQWTPQAEAQTVIAKGGRGKPRTRRISRNKTTHTIVGGDTLQGIAKKYGVTVEQLRAWNPKLKGSSLVKGRTLTIWTARQAPARRTETHKVKKGETLSQIAEMYSVSVAELKAWNPKLKNPRALKVGSELRVHKWEPGKVSKASGNPNAGRLGDGIPLKSGHGYHVRNVARAYGTHITVSLLDECISKTRRKHPRAHDLLVGDLSFENGGYMKPHKSHQNGRDADVSYYFKQVDNPYRFTPATARTIDADKTWDLFECFIDSGKVTYIFVDYPLQEVLYEEARKEGKKAEYLDKVFQYPKGRGSSTGIIRYSRGHDDHFHIRFTCDPKNPNCHD